MPHPPHVMNYFGPLEKYYGDLAREENLRRLAKDVVAHVRWHIHPWTTAIKEEALVQTAAPRDLFGIYAALYEQYMLSTGKRRWGCKSTFMIHYVDRILARYPEARLLWLVRDPRDVALSSRESVFNPFHPYYTARLWTAQQELGLKLEATLRPANLLRVHYEALIADPNLTVERICQFIGVSFEPDMLRFFETEEARTSAKLARDWRNTAVPIISGNANKFRGRMSEDEIAIVEAVAGDTMKKLGYETIGESGTPSQPGALRRARYRLRNELRRLFVEYKSLRGDRNQWLRWYRGIRMMNLKMRLKMRAMTMREARKIAE